MCHSRSATAEVVISHAVIKYTLAVIVVSQDDDDDSTVISNMIFYSRVFLFLFSKKFQAKLNYSTNRHHHAFSLLLGEY